jgi:hypothetical protein
MGLNDPSGVFSGRQLATQRVPFLEVLEIFPQKIAIFRLFRVQTATTSGRGKAGFEEGDKFTRGRIQPRSKVKIFASDQRSKTIVSYPLSPRVEGAVRSI